MKSMQYGYDCARGENKMRELAFFQSIFPAPIGKITRSMPARIKNGGGSLSRQSGYGIFVVQGLKIVIWFSFGK